LHSKLPKLEQNIYIIGTHSLVQNHQRKLGWLDGGSVINWLDITAILQKGHRFSARLGLLIEDKDSDVLLLV
jgi:hypothetical protein